LAILNGVLQLMAPTAPRQLRLSIDYFFRSLARDRGANAIAVVLSGAGSDGTLGVRAIKGDGGIVVIQDPETAAYNSMPASALATGLADVVLPPGEIGPWLRDYEWQLLQPEKNEQVRQALRTGSELSRLFVLVRNHTGYDFSLYKEGTICRRIERRMVVNQVKGLSDYVNLLQDSNEELDRLWKEFLIRVTQFFRNTDAFDTLAKQVVPTLFSQHDQPLRIWVPACSTGEEAYSIGILIQDHMERSGHVRPVQIFATDIDDEALDIGRAGIYPETILADVPADLLRRYFVKHPAGFQVVKQIRAMMVFSRHDITRDPPFSRLDMVSCRNLLIYMSAELQGRILNSFSYALRRNGALFIGHSEHIGKVESLYDCLDSQAKLYRRNSAMLRDYSPVQRPAWRQPGEMQRRSSDPRAPIEDIQQLTHKTLLKEYTPACVVIDRRKQIQYVHGHVGAFLEPAAGRPSVDILKMARDGLRSDLLNAIRGVLDGEPMRRVDRLPIKHADGLRLANLTVRPLAGIGSGSDLLLVVFEDAGRIEQPSDKLAETAARVGNWSERVALLEQELSETRETLQDANERLESGNEELHSTVEELQSSNEELMTSQEELSSINEELHTVNCELEEKVRELETTGNDLENLLVSTEIATVFLDLDLCIRRFTPAAVRVINLIASDVGRPLADIVHQLDYDQLIADAESVLDQVRPMVREVHSRDGISYSLRIGLYRTSSNAIDGVVLTFTDLTDRIIEEKRFIGLLELAPDATLISDASGGILQVNAQAEALFGYPRNELIGRQIEFLVPVALRDRHGEQRRAYQGNATARPIGQRGRALTALRKDGSEFDADIAIGPIHTSKGKLFVSCIRDTSDTERTRQRLSQSNRLILGLLRWQRDGPLTGVMSIDTLLERLCRELVDYVGYRACWIGLGDIGLGDRADDADHALVASRGLRDSAESPFRPEGLPANFGPLPLIFSDLMHDDAGPLRQWVLAGGCRSAIVAPLATATDRLGVMIICSDTPNDFVVEELTLWQTVADTIGRLLEQGTAGPATGHPDQAPAG
jgi:two-component system, chemotaxis family, CheB/CheR fusion protein